ncbi:MAG: TolC family protein [Myxococcales bacterium]|nr:TolC family protein [Myxococcales bacterium]
MGIATSLEANNSDADENGVRSDRQAYGEFNIDQLRPAFLGRMTVIQPLTTFGKIGLRDKAAKAGLRAAKAQTDMTAADVAVEVAALYEAHLYAKEILLFVQDIQNVAGRAVQETEDRLDADAFDVNQQDLLRLKTALGAAKLAQHQANAALSQTLEGLRAYLAIDDDVELSVEERYLDPVSEQPTVLEELIKVAKARRPEIRALENGVAAYEALAEAERAEYFPNLFALGFLSGAYTPDRDLVQSRFVVDPLHHFVTGALVGAQWRIQWDMATHRAREVESQAYRLANLLEWARVGVPAQVNRYHEEVTRARQDLVQLEETIPVTREWVVRASADYAAGFGDSRGVTDAVTAFVSMKNYQLDALYRLNTGLAELARATGTLTERDSFLYPGTPK